MVAYGWLASLADSELRRRSGKVARHIVVGTAWGRVSEGVDWRGARTPGLCARGVACGWGRRRMTDGLLRQVAAVLVAAGCLFLSALVVGVLNT